MQAIPDRAPATPAARPGPSLSADDAHALQRLRIDCGCRVGEVGMAALTLTALADVALAHRPHTTGGAALAVSAVCAAAVTGGIAGKALGVLTARVRYVATARRMGVSIT